MILYPQSSSYTTQERYSIKIDKTNHEKGAATTTTTGTKTFYENKDKAQFFTCLIENILMPDLSEQKVIFLSFRIHLLFLFIVTPLDESKAFFILKMIKLYKLVPSISV